MIRVVVLALLFLPSALAGQLQLTEPEERERALATVRAMGHGGMAISVLTQEHRSRSPAVLDAFADTLVAIAISHRFDTSKVGRRAVRAAIVALVASTRAERGRVAYPRAFERLVRIYEGSDGGLSGGILGALTELPDLGPVVDFLADVASSPDAGRATTAIRHLAHDTGSGGRARLRRLWERDEVVDPVAREHVSAIAHALGWGR